MTVCEWCGEAKFLGLHLTSWFAGLVGGSLAAFITVALS